MGSSGTIGDLSTVTSVDTFKPSWVRLEPLSFAAGVESVGLQTLMGSSGTDYVDQRFLDDGSLQTLMGSSGTQTMVRALHQFVPTFKPSWVRLERSGLGLHLTAGRSFKPSWVRLEPLLGV